MKGSDIYGFPKLKEVYKMQSITFNKAILNFNNYLYKENKAEATAIAYIKDLELFKEFLVKKLNNKIRTLDKITLAEIEEYKYFLSKKIKEGEFKRTTASRKFNALKTFFAYLSKDYGIQNIVYGDDWSNRARTKDFTEEGEDYLPNILEIEDVDILLHTIQNSTDKNKYRDLAIVETLVGIGCRRSELLNMKWHHINFYRGEIKLIRQKGKNSNTLKMPREMQQALEQYRNTLVDIEEYVFVSRQSGQLGKSAFSSAIKKWITLSGLQSTKNFEITAHTFRHTFITLCIRANIPDSKIIEYTGHSDVESLNIYKHLVAKDMEDIANLRSSLKEQQKRQNNITYPKAVCL